MIGVRSRRERHVDDCAFELDQHIESILAIVLSPILDHDAKAAVKHLCKTGKIVAMIDDVAAPLGFGTRRQRTQISLPSTFSVRDFTRSPIFGRCG